MISNQILIRLEMRVFGDEAHINIGLTDLFVTAAPILKLLAQHDLQLTPQCIMYLVEGIEVVFYLEVYHSFQQKMT